VLVDLRRPTRPRLLAAWASARGLAVRWRAGASFAVLSGPPAALDRAFGVRIDDYRTAGGERFFGALAAPPVPATLETEISAIGRIGSAPVPRPVVIARASVPAGGLTAGGVVEAYGAARLRSSGDDGSGQTIVFLEWTPPDPKDLATFVGDEKLPPLRTVLAGEGGSGSFADAPVDPAAVSADTVEADMDVEVAHEIAPGAKIVVYDANPSAAGGAAPIATMFQDVAQAYPGAVWSSSIGWGCDQLFTWADLQAVDSALAAAEQGGTTAFDASGDTDGLECKENIKEPFDTPPQQPDVGVDGIASLPSMTSVGGTTLSVAPSGAWFSEEAWDDSTLAQGTGGGVSTVIPRPSWQQGPGVAAGLPAANAGWREVPDVSADADAATGIAVVTGGSLGTVGGTSQAAPIWAALTALMDQYLEQHHGRAVGAINPILYALASSPGTAAGFHDVTLGGNAVHAAGVGYDMVTGLGTPDIDLLVRDVLRYQETHP
jgi:kumamolisin